MTTSSTGVPAVVEGEVRALPRAGTVSPPEKGAYVGVFAPHAPFDFQTFDAYVEDAEQSPAILMWYQPWAKSGASGFDTAAVVSTIRRGALPLITWEPWDPGKDANLVENPGDQPEFRLQRIVDGEFDAYIRGWARSIADLGFPIMLRPMHEMNGVWYPWGGPVNDNSPELFIQAWRRVHGIFEEEGATNVTWIWSVNCESLPDVPDNAFELYYPGDEYVDWTGLSGFNWGTSRPGMKWTAFDDLYGRPVERLEAFGKPIIISEFASVEGPGDKAEWISDAYTRIREDYPSVGAVIYYDKAEKGLNGKQDWNIRSSPESLAAYRKAVSKPYFVGAPVSELKEWVSRLEKDDWTYLRQFSRLYSPP